MRRVLVTGSAGFIGYHVTQRLLRGGDVVMGFDNMNAYYDVALKNARLEKLRALPLFEFVKGDLADRAAVEGVLADFKPTYVVHLAAQAGVRYSVTHPHAYGESNLTGFLNVLEGCRRADVRHLVFASSSSVYGANRVLPFSARQNVDHPISLYAATKKANEIMAHSYAHLYGLPTTGLRFFTVYGPWGRPDMALFIFTRAILAGETIDVYNHGHMRRDFTYVDDVVEAINRLVDHPPRPEANAEAATLPDRSSAPYRIYNIGNNEPVELLHLISVLEKELGTRASTRLLPMQPGDVPETYADVDDLMADIGFRPSTTIETGVKRFVAWYRAYYVGATTPPIPPS